MPHDKKIIIGNWKMNFDMQESSLFLHKLSNLVKNRRDVEVVLAPSLLVLQSLSLQVNTRQFKLAAQNFYWRDSGSFTGEVSASQLRGIVQYALVGHSERRNIFNEDNKIITEKVAAAVRNHIQPVLFIGESFLEKSNGETHDVLHDQLISGLANITSEELDNVLIAYEPIWAIGTGKNALPDDVKASVDTIRNQIKHLYGEKASESIKVLYGGSVTANSAADYLALSGVDGLVVAPASLNTNAFNEILKKAHSSSIEVNKD